MGSHYFKDCRADQRFTILNRLPILTYGYQWLVEDWDQRRVIEVHAPGEEREEDSVFEALEKFIDDLPADVVQVVISDNGMLLSSISDPMLDASRIPLYPSRTDFPPDVATVRRHNLTEVDRFGLQVDLTTYQASPGETRQVVFKYYISENNIALFWHEANCVMRMPRHPNIVPFDALVVDTVEDIDKVVGFTTRYVPGGTLEENKDRIFKLKYLKQLISVIDYINLRLGIVHGDICPWNLLIDPETDNIQIFDFNSAAKLGWEGDQDYSCEFEYEEDRNDVKFVVFTLYEIITREFSFRGEFYPHELDMSEVLGKPEWKKHPNVHLDNPVPEYRRVLAEWVSQRESIDREINHFTKASEPLDWPSVPNFPVEEGAARQGLRPGEYRAALFALNKDFLKWQRPPTRDLPLPQGCRLLATGEIVRDDRDSSITTKT